MKTATGDVLTVLTLTQKVGFGQVKQRILILHAVRTFFRHGTTFLLFGDSHILGINSPSLLRLVRKLQLVVMHT